MADRMGLEFADSHVFSFYTHLHGKLNNVLGENRLRAIRVSKVILVGIFVDHESSIIPLHYRTLPAAPDS